MLRLLGELLPLAMAMAVVPFRLTVLILLLGTAQGRSRSTLFVLGTLLGEALLCVLALLAGHYLAQHLHPRHPAHALARLALGGLFLVLAGASFRGHGVSRSAARWLQQVDRAGPALVLAAGLVSASGSLDHLLLSVAAIAEVARAGVSLDERALALCFFLLLSVSPFLVVWALPRVAPKRAGRMLESLRRWLEANGAAVLGAVFLLLAAVLLGKGLAFGH